LEKNLLGKLINFKKKEEQENYIKKKMKIKVQEKLIDVTEEHLWTFPVLNEMYKLDKESTFTLSDFILEEDVFDALNSKNGEAKTFPGLYVQDFLGGNMLRILFYTERRVQPFISNEYLDQHYNPYFEYIPFVDYDKEIELIYREKKFTIKVLYDQNKIVVLSEGDLKYLINHEIIESNFSSVSYDEKKREITFLNEKNLVFPIDERVWNIMQMCGPASFIYGSILPSIINYLYVQCSSSRLFPNSEENSTDRKGQYLDDLFYQLINYEPFVKTYSDNQKYSIIRSLEYDGDDLKRKFYDVKSIGGLLEQEFHEENFIHVITVVDTMVQPVNKFRIENKYCSVLLIYGKTFYLQENRKYFRPFVCFSEYDEDNTYSTSDSSEASFFNSDEDNNSSSEYNSDEDNSSEKESSPIIRDKNCIYYALIDNVLCISVMKNGHCSVICSDYMKGGDIINDDEYIGAITLPLQFPKGTTHPNISRFGKKKDEKTISVPWMTEKFLYMLKDTKFIPLKAYIFTKLINETNGINLFHYCGYNYFKPDQYKQKIEEYLDLLHSVKSTLQLEMREYMQGSILTLPDYVSKIVGWR